MMDPILDDIETSINPLYAKNKECKLFSTVTGNCYSDGDFTTGSYWAKNIREPVLFEQALHAVTKDKHSRTNVVFVEIGPRRALQRNIHETLGNNTIVLPSVQPEKDYNTILSTVAKLFELGNSVDWHQLYRGYETLPTEFPVYQFVNTTKELHFEAVIKGNESSAFPPHKEYICNLSLETAPYLWEHKNNGVPIVPGAFFVELAYASVMASLRPKKPVSLLQLSVRFENLFALSSNSHQLKVTLEPGENVASFKIHSPVATHSSGTYRCTDGQTQLEEPTICLDMIYQRCKLVMKKKEIYSILSQAGFEYGNVFEQLDDVHFGEDFKEAVTAIQVPKELLKHLHDYFIHPVLLDYFLQMTAVVAIGRLTAKQGFPSAISSVAISAPLQENMFMYLRATQETPGFLDVSGGFSNTDGHVLVELIGVRISFLGNCSNGLQSRFFHNEMTSITDKEDLQNSKIKAIVFEDKLGIAKGLRPYLHPDSAFVESGEHWMADQIRKLVLDSLKSNVDLENVLFLWGVDDFSHLSPEKMLDHLVTCCELFRQIVLVLKESKRSFTVRVITNRSTEMTVDHVSPGFVLSGMTRSCAAEIAGLSFQLIDLASVTGEDIQMLVCVINTCQHHEVMISNGHASTTRIVRTPMREEVLCEGDMRSGNEDDFVLQTTDPYRMAHLSAVLYDTNASPVQEKSVEIQLTTLCAHSSDYFPVTTSHLNFGKTMYWNKHTSLNHKLLALDFSGIVTAVGKNVYNLRVRDHIASCYPVAATAKIIIPEAVCYSTKKLPILKETPCVSYFILAWEILQRMLSKVLQAISMIKERFHSCPIKGVFHSAAVLHDALIENLDESLFRKVLQPKVCGALNLHYATLHNKLDFFVCYSSISSFIGNASQCNYAAANSFLDSFCHYRRNLGLAGQSINWGPLNLGLLLNKDNFQQFLEAKGMMVMDVCYVQKALETCLVMNRPQQVICKFNFKNLHIHVLSQNASLRERLSALVEMEFKDYLNNEPRVQHLSSPHESVRRIVSDISNVSVDELDDDSTLCGLGIDSMLAMTLQNKMFQETGVNVPLVKILDPNSTLATLAGIVMNG
ncbi:Mycolipanoate synthase [Dissostichus eleginoides]|uniref:Mycolipanoate synthase n=1 Tax=Dissostichus eleginoides TaxID=100907 RepID=A0AAD9BK43_DISEL|nr:Mycolipanoate synthase [Dissostichus eleginoides]